MREKLRENLVPVGLSLLLHAAVIAAFGVSIRWSEPGRAQLASTQPVVQATLIDEGRIEQEMRRLEARDQRVRREREAEQQRLEEARRQKELEQQRLAELERERELVAAEAAAERQRVAEAERQAAEAQARREEQARREREEQERLERLRKEREAEEQRLAMLEKQREEAERRRKEAEERAKREEEARLAAQREAELQRALAEEERRAELVDSGLLAQYKTLIAQKVERNWVQPASARAGLSCRVRVRQLPTGDVGSVEIETCNGDEAVRRSIEAAVLRASPLPLPPDPRLFERNLIFDFEPEQ